MISCTRYKGGLTKFENKQFKLQLHLSKTETKRRKKNSNLLIKISPQLRSISPIRKLIHLFYLKIGLPPIYHQFAIIGIPPIHNEAIMGLPPTSTYNSKSTGFKNPQLLTTGPYHTKAVKTIISSSKDKFMFYKSVTQNFYFNKQFPKTC